MGMKLVIDEESYVTEKKEKEKRYGVPLKLIRVWRQGTVTGGGLLLCNALQMCVSKQTESDS